MNDRCVISLLGLLTRVNRGEEATVVATVVEAGIVTVTVEVTVFVRLGVAALPHAAAVNAIAAIPSARFTLAIRPV
jgi:hypothetical protein